MSPRRARAARRGFIPAARGSPRVPPDLATALAYALAPAALGALLAVILVLRAHGDLAHPPDPEAQGRLVIVLALPLRALLLGLVGALQAPAATQDLTLPLLALGAAGFAQALAQGVVGARRRGAILADPAAFGRALVLMSLPEILPVGALVWLVTSMGAGGA